MIPIMLLMLAGGIGLTQAVSDPAAVTLRWLRLGGIIAITLLAVMVVALVSDSAQDVFILKPFEAGVDLGFMIILLMAPAFFQLMLTQVGRRMGQRACAMGSYVVVAVGVWVMLCTLSGMTIDGRSEAAARAAHDSVAAGKAAALGLTALLSTGLLGGFLMTMLLGHAYLTAGNEMTQAPFRRLVALLGLLLVLRAIGSVVFGLVPWLSSERTGSQLWPMMIIIARYAVGLIVTGIFTWMVWDCVKRRANQSATGILYVAGVLIIVGEWSALALVQRTGLAF